MKRIFLTLLTALAFQAFAEDDLVFDSKVSISNGNVVLSECVNSKYCAETMLSKKEAVTKIKERSKHLSLIISSDESIKKYMNEDSAFRHIHKLKDGNVIIFLNGKSGILRIKLEELNKEESIQNLLVEIEAEITSLNKILDKLSSHLFFLDESEIKVLKNAINRAD